MVESFIERVSSSYSPKGDFIHLGAGILNQQIIKEAAVKLPLASMNRHGLIAGATGTGKTRTLQLISEQLSDKGVPVFMLDVKGDVSGLATPGPVNDKLLERAQAVGIEFKPQGFPIELFSLSGKNGVPMRLNVDDFGPVLLARILDLNETQSGILSVLFKYSDDHRMPLVTLEDLKKLLGYLSQGPGAAEIKGEYGTISSASSGAILRKIVAVEQQGLGDIFGEVSFDVMDLIQLKDGKGVISLLNISDMQDKPIVFSTFLLSLLARLFKELPEVGDLDKPKLVFFFDEAHLLFNKASKNLLAQIEQIVRLIRSKGVGVFFCTQAPTDIPESVLGQLGSRVQHALRAFTPKDADNLKKTVKTYPVSDFYQVDQELTSLGTGQALITVLNEKGIPTEVVSTHLVPARAIMGPANLSKCEDIIRGSKFYDKYQHKQEINGAGAIVDQKIAQFEAAEARAKNNKPANTRRRSARQTPLETAKTTAARESVKILGRIANQILTSFFKKK